MSIDTLALPGPGDLGVDTTLPQVAPGLGAGNVQDTGLGAPLVQGLPGTTRTPFSPANPGDMQVSGGSGARADVVRFAQKFIGDPYVWGGTKPGGFDCSGFTQFILGRAGGIHLPRISFQQAEMGESVPINRLQPGDLVAWDNSSRNAGADHIAIYIGNGQVIEAPHPGGHVQIVPIGVVGKNPMGVHLNYQGDR